MAQSRQKKQQYYSEPSRQAAHKQSKIPLIIILACGVLVYLIVMFDNSFAWPNSTYGASAPADTEQQADGQKAPKGGHVTVVPGANQVLRAEFTLASQSPDANRVKNIYLAAEALNNVTIDPGDTLSFNKLVGNVGKDKEYQVAQALGGYMAAEVRGGGVSQVSSALYAAALYADLEIVEREAHNVLADYVIAGLDAAVDYDASMDLRIKNTSGEPILLSVEGLGQSVAIKIYGKALEDGRTINTTTKAMGYNKLYNEDTKAEDLYCTIAAWRIYLDNGTETNRVYLDTKVYLDILSETG